MHGLGIDIAHQPGVVLDVEPRRKKSPRAFCAPVHAPGEVYLVLSPVGGVDDFSVLFHEGGHTEHFAHVDPELPFEFRLLGDNAITEAYAFLFQHLVEDPDWLTAQLGVADPEPICAHARAQRLVYLRRYTGKLAYELELHAGNRDRGDGGSLRRAAGARAADRVAPAVLPRRRRPGLLLRRVSAGVGTRDPSPGLSPRAFRCAMVDCGRGRRRAAGAVARRPAPDGGGAARAS